MEKLAEILAWPVVVLVIVLVLIFLFRAEFGALIARTKKVGKGGLETYEGQPPQPKDDSKGVEQFFRTYDNPLLLEAEGLIMKDLKDRKIENHADREKTLVRALASSQLISHFERLDRGIWASQLALLRGLNTREGGTEAHELMPLYEDAKTNYPSWYQDYSFEQWLGFLRSFNLVTQKDSRYFITVAGREFLKYLIAVGKAAPLHG